MDLLRELKAMPVTLNLLQVGLGAPPAWDSSWVPGRACWPLPRGLGWYKRLSWRTPSVPLSVAQEDKGAPTVFLADAPGLLMGQKPSERVSTAQAGPRSLPHGSLGGSVRRV